MPKYITATLNDEQDAWFFVIEDDIIVWGQYYAHIYSLDWTTSAYENEYWSQVEDNFTLNGYTLLEED
jgi:hypothetical protein